MPLKSTFALSAGLIAGAQAFWRMECPGRVSLARIDPIVNPGEPSTHVHAIHGSSGISETATTNDLLAGDCTSCRVTQDKSSYWQPALYFQNADTGEYEVVQQVGGMLAYYLLYGDNITAFPPGFQMISGDNKRRNYTVADPNKPDPPKSDWASLGQTKQSDLAQRALGFNCLNYAKKPEGTLYRHYMPDKAYLDANCNDGIRLEIMFPSCWKGGKAVDSPNHQDHVAFPDLVMTGTCPEGYPVRLPSLLYEVIWNTNAFAHKRGKFVFSNGDTTGYGYHADFMMGWEQPFLQEAVNTCKNESGRIEDCPLFNVVGQDKATGCSMQQPLLQAIFHEDVKGPFSVLPGLDSQGLPIEDVTDPKPKLDYRPGEKASASASPLPGQVFKEQAAVSAVSAVVGAATSFVAHVMPKEPAPSAPPSGQPTPPPAVPADPSAGPAAQDQSFFSTQYITAGKVVTKVLWKENRVYVTEGAAGSGASPAPAPLAGPAGAGTDKLRRRSAHLHGHRRGALH